MTRWWTTAALAIGVAASCGGCTAYVPKPGPRVAETSEGYYRGGELVPHGFLDTGLVDAVHGNPEAEGYAKKYRGLQVSGFVLDVAGLGLAVGGLVPLSRSADAYDPYQDPDQQASQRVLGLGLLAGGAVLLAVGLSLQATAGPAKLDAINAYNDGALGLAAPHAAETASAPTAPPPPPAPTSTGAGCSKDTDCKNERLCVRAECVDAPRPRR